MRDFGVAVDASLPSGLEIGSGFALVTAVYRAKGWPMCSQINAFHDEEVLSKRIEGLIAEGKINWLWLAPPLRTFSPLHSSCIAGDLRPRGLPEGDGIWWPLHFGPPAVQQGLAVEGYRSFLAVGAGVCV